MRLCNSYLWILIRTFNRYAERLEIRVDRVGCHHLELRILELATVCAVLVPLLGEALVLPFVCGAA